MYKLLLSWRYLRKKYIALASIISVTLGVATLIIVNSVMAGFTNEMHIRLHSILSDVVLECHDLSGLHDLDAHLDRIRTVVGDDLEQVSGVVHVPAMLGIGLQNGRRIERPITLMGVDPETYAKVAGFKPHLLHPENQKKVSFDLRPDGYAPGRENFPPAGWDHRRWRYQNEALRQMIEQRSASDAADTGAGGAETFDPTSIPLPAKPPELAPDIDQPAGGESRRADPFRLVDDQNQAVFDPATEQHTGAIVGIGLCSTRARDATGEARDFYYCLPGDDVTIMFPNASDKTVAVYDTFTVVDLYETKMSEYDSSLVFVPIQQLQKLRQMGDAVTTIQMKLRDGADLNAVRDLLRAEFPPDLYPYDIQTWRDMQGPLLSAVQMETTLLNILLFLIIAVAGFGILATFYMIVVEKTRDIGILKALGAPRRGVMSIFLTYGFSLGLVGSGVGMILGLVFVAYINEIADVLELITGQEVFDQTIYYFAEIPTITRPMTVFWVVVGALLIAVMASILPALRAAKLHPVEALRYE